MIDERGGGEKECEKEEEEREKEAEEVMLVGVLSPVNASSCFEPSQPLGIILGR